MTGYDDTAATFWKEPEGPRRPRIALMGEFSAGKSTLANLMIGANPVPVQVIATQLPPVWISYGDRETTMVDIEGKESPCDLSVADVGKAEETALIRCSCKADILTKCDIIDMPGISDPNMQSEVWQRIMPFADGVVWCSPANQAWRQSEAAVWETIDADVQKHSLLLLTRGDMLLTPKDKSKVLKRVEAQAGPMFQEVLLMSLVQARAAEDDETIWLESGADDFVNAFLKMLEHIEISLGNQLSNAVDGSVTPVSLEQNESLAVTEHQIVPRRPIARGGTNRSVEPTASAPVDPMSFMPKFS